MNDNVIDEQYLEHQSQWSLRTFGPGERTAGVIAHIKKELKEIKNDPTGTEWVDVIILALDGFWRAGYSPDEILYHIAKKQSINEERTWPDWRTFSEGQAIEHVRD